jgi:hypothetical protein
MKKEDWHWFLLSGIKQVIPSLSVVYFRTKFLDGPDIKAVHDKVQTKLCRLVLVHDLKILWTAAADNFRSYFINWPYRG